MSEYAQQASDLQPKFDLAKAAAGAARAGFLARFPQDESKKKGKEIRNDE